MSLAFEEARRIAIAEAERLRGTAIERVPLDLALGRVLAEDVAADRDQPPFDRSTRDGFAVRSADVPGRLVVVGEVAAGEAFGGAIGPGECVEIMTGAPVPAGADAVVMVEHTTRDGEFVTTARGATPGENVVPTGSEARAGDRTLSRGARIDPAAIAMLASVGCAKVPVYARPRVAVIGTGHELVEADRRPSPTQIRNSNSWSLAAQIARAGGEARRMPIAPDTRDGLRAILDDALATSDVVVLSGGVSMGKYDLVEEVLAELGARVCFDGVDIRPGKPAVLTVVGSRLVFGLPGNPLSTTLTFELLARPAIEIVGGASTAPLGWLEARLAGPFRQRALPLLVFAPSIVDERRAVVPLSTQGSGDLAALARATHWAVIPPGTTELAAGTTVAVAPK